MAQQVKGRATKTEYPGSFPRKMGEKNRPNTKYFALYTCKCRRVSKRSFRNSTRTHAACRSVREHERRKPFSSVRDVVQAAQRIVVPNRRKPPETAFRLLRTGSSKKNLRGVVDDGKGPAPEARSSG